MLTRYSWCHGCGEDRDVHRIRLQIARAAHLTEFELCSECLRELGEQANNAAFEAGATA